MTNGERIRESRKEKGLTQKELGELLNVTQATIQQYESGNPKPETLKRIADALGITVAKLLGKEFSMFDMLSQVSLQYDEQRERLVNIANELPSDVLLKLVKMLDGASIDEVEQIVYFGEILRKNADSHPTGFSLTFENDRSDESDGAGEAQ